MTAAAPSPELLDRLARRFGNSPRFAYWRDLQLGAQPLDGGVDSGRRRARLAPVLDDVVLDGAPGDRVGHDDGGPLRAHEDADAELDARGAARAVLDAPAGGCGAVVVSHARESESASPGRQARIRTGFPVVCSFG